MIYIHIAISIHLVSAVLLTSTNNHSSLLLKKSPKNKVMNQAKV